MRGREFLYIADFSVGVQISSLIAFSRGFKNFLRIINFKASNIISELSKRAFKGK